MKDFYGRSIDYLRISITDRCNLRCKYCMPSEGVDKIEHDEILRFEEIVQIINTGVNYGIKKIRITGGEPLVRKGVENLISEISRIPQIEDLTLTTNGTLLKEKAKALKDAGLKRINISIDTLNEKKYRDITRGGSIEHVLNGIEESLKVGLAPIKLNVVLIEGFNEDEINDFVELTQSKSLVVRFIELMPGSTKWSDYKYLPNKIVLDKIPDLIPVDRENFDGPSKYYQKQGYKGKVGLISAISDYFCASCNRIRITASGRIRPCLHSNLEVDLRYVLRNNPEKLDEVFKRGIVLKPKKHFINEHVSYIKNNRFDMSKIGG